ncbi:MAG: hypothetical protein R3260_19125 [Pseudomonas sp.]|nr:hypothetical protein [Pseudomonas sp.]
MLTIKHLLMNPDPAPAGGGDPAPVDPAPADPAPADPAPAGQAPADTGGTPPAAIDPEPMDPAPADPNAAFFETLPEDWRQQTVEKMGLEEKHLNVLNRYPSFDKFVESFFEKNDLIAKGAHKQGLPDDPTEEQLADYREQNGIPATPEDYQLTLDDGLVLGEDDERVMQPVFQAAHAHNVPASTMSELTNAMLKGREAEMEAELAQHGIDSQTATRQIKDAWGADYETNKNIILGMYNTLPEGVRENFMKAQLPDGRMLFNSSEFLVWSADVARKLNPGATVVPNSNNPAEGINSEIERIEDTMRNDPDAYWRDQTMQTRYEKLLEARENMQKQQA